MAAPELEAHPERDYWMIAANQHGKIRAQLEDDENERMKRATR